MDVLAKISEWLKFSTHQLVWLLLFSSFVLGLLNFAPDSVLVALSLRDLRTDYRTWIGLLGIISFSGLVVVVGKSAFQWAKSAFTKRQETQRRRQRLHDLTPSERAILRKYIKGNTRTRSLPIDNGVVQGLVYEKILYRSSNIGNSDDMAFDHNIQPWAWDYLKEHPELVEEREKSRGS